MNSKWSVNKLGRLALSAWLCLPGAAWAGPGSGPHEHNPELRAARQAAKQAEREEKREARQAARETQVDGRRPNRLTPEERRDLRRQINQAGQDLYRDEPKK